jgi:hypothetical protein
VFILTDSDGFFFAPFRFLKNGYFLLTGPVSLPINANPRKSLQREAFLRNISVLT